MKPEFLAYIWILAPFEALAVVPGPAPGLSGYRIGSVLEFENEITTSRCYPVVDKNGVIDLWVSEYHTAESRVLVRRCVEFEPRKGHDASEKRHGDSGPDWEELTVSERDGTLLASDLSLPAFQYFSNPGFCGTKVAYWIQDANRWSVRLYDLKSNSTLRTEFIREEVTETDNPNHFERPQWKDTCRLLLVEGHGPVESK